MSLRNAKVGDVVVYYPYGIGTIVKIGWSSKSGNYGPGIPSHIWPINAAPDWVWGALGIEKPKKKVEIVVEYYHNIYSDENLGCIYVSKEECLKNITPEDLVQSCVKLTSKPFLVDAGVVDKITGARVV